MKLSAHSSPLHEVPADWLIISKWENEPLSGPVAELDSRMEKTLSRLMERGDITGKAKEVTPIYDVRGIAAQRVSVLGLGKRELADAGLFFSAAASAAKFVTTKSCRRLALAVPVGDAGSTSPDPIKLVRLMAAGLMFGCEGPGIRKSKPDRFAPEEIWLVVSNAGLVRSLEPMLRRTEIEGRAVSLARELVNMPPCDLYPQTFADRAVLVAEKTGLDCQVLDEAQIAQEKMGSLLGVAQGSDRPPRLVTLRHRKGGKGKTLGLVGKGVTFDSGGLSLKIGDGMVDMKCDMAGAAAVLGAMQAIAELDLPVNVIGVMALVENLPSGKAMKLGDVLHARNGKTIECLNTDAEGRLILADALTWAVDQKADRLVDLATLTGACVVALGSDVAGAMTNNETWSEAVISAARTCGEAIWPLPMYPFYSEQLKSEVADLKNVTGTRWGGAITAAKFLEEFVAGVPWVHLDIAGPAWSEKDSPTKAAGGTGCFVRTLVELAQRQAE